MVHVLFFPGGFIIRTEGRDVAAHTATYSGFVFFLHIQKTLNVTDAFFTHYTYWPNNNIKKTHKNELTKKTFIKNSIKVSDAYWMLLIWWALCSITHRKKQTTMEMSLRKSCRAALNGIVHHWPLSDMHSHPFIRWNLNVWFHASVRTLDCSSSVTRSGWLAKVWLLT